MSLKGIREGLADSLDAVGLRPMISPPAKVTAPMVVFTPAEDWITHGGTFGSYDVSYVLSVFVRIGTNEVMLTAAEAAVANLIPALGNEWGVVSIGAPFMAATGDQLIPCVEVTVAYRGLDSLA